MRSGRAFVFPTSFADFRRLVLSPVRPTPQAARIKLWAAIVAVAASCSFLLAAPASAQTNPPSGPPSSSSSARTFMIRGSLRLASNSSPAEMIRIELKKFTGETVAVAFTGSNGDFEFGGLASGAYLIMIEEQGYEPIRESVEVRNTLRTGIYLYLREPVKLGANPSTSPPVSARELALPSKAAGDLRKGKQELFTKKNASGSVKHLQKLAAEAPDFYEAHYYLGLAFSDLGRTEEADAELRTAIARSDQTHAPSFTSLASLLCNHQRFAEAEPLARKSIELDPGRWQGYFELARALNGLDRPNDALKSADVVSKKQADFPELQLLLANIHIRRDDPTGLLGALDGYLRLKPEGPMSDQVRETRKKVLEDMARAGLKPAAQSPPPRP